MAENRELEILSRELQELEAQELDSEKTLTRRVTFWGIRWSIGFAVIWAAVTYEPAWSWLWWAGAVLAACSLFAIFLVRALLRRRFRGVKRAAEEAREVARRFQDEGPESS